MMPRTKRSDRPGRDIMLGYSYQVDPITQYAHQQLHPPTQDRCQNREKDMKQRYQVLG